MLQDFHFGLFEYQIDVALLDREERHAAWEVPYIGFPSTGVERPKQIELVVEGVEDGSVVRVDSLHDQGILALA